MFGLKKTTLPLVLWHAQIRFDTRGRTLDNIYSVGQDIVALMGAMEGGPLARLTAGDLVRGGHARVLIGQSEGHWLDVKSQHYDLGANHQEKYRLLSRSRGSATLRTAG